MHDISRLASLVIGLCACSAALAESTVFYGPIYSNYKKGLQSGGGCVSGSIGTTIPARIKFTIAFASENNSESAVKRGDLIFLSYNKPEKHEIQAGAVRADLFFMCLKP